jgi:hypothetical protein
LLDNGTGRHEDALAAAELTTADSNSAWFYSWGWVELLEAAARTGKTERAVGALAPAS